MQSGAHVTSLTALEDVRAGVCMFADEVGGALAILQSEIGRFVEWLEHDQLSYWKREIRQREERLAEAKTDLHRCLAATIDPERTPSCYQEKKLVESCKRRLEEAEQKFAAVRRWIPIVKQAVFEYTLKVEPLQSAVSADMPRAAAAIDSAIARILAYVDASPTRRPESLATEPRGAAPVETQPPTAPPKTDIEPTEAATTDAAGADRAATAGPGESA